MYCQTVIKRRNAFRGFVGPTTETRRSDDGAVRSKKRLPKWQKHPHALSILKDTTTPKPRTYEYDGNGNPISYEGFKDFRVMVWDEENRLQGLNDNGKLHLYTYDHTGERAVKSSAESQKTVINGVSSAVIVHAENYTAYVNPYFVVNKGKFTKHYFEGTSRIVSKLGEGTFHQPTGLTAGGIDYIKQSAKIQEAIDNYVRGLNVPPGPPTQHGIYGTPDFTGQEYPSIDWSDISQDQEPPEGWPRPPKFNEPGDVPGPPVQYGDPVKPETVEGGFGFKDNGIEERNLYYYHPDHLGSSSYITDKDGNISQHTEYIAFGEVLFDEHKVSRRMPYLFNGKELDSETGLYYYGARYYDPRVSIFLNVDPLAEKTFEPYSYVGNNPIMFTDPTGMSKEQSGNPKGDPGYLLTPVYRSVTVGGLTFKAVTHYKFKAATAHLLRLVSGLHINAINNTKVILVPTGTGGSITLGKSPSEAYIAHFSGESATDPQKTITFLKRNAHEVGHIEQLKNGNTKHMLSSFSEYVDNIMSGQDWHDGSFATKEKQADIVEQKFENFYNFVNKNYGKNEMKKLFESKKSEGEKIEIIDKWYKSFKEQDDK
ncbi:hypothetical protein PG593_08535 [Riemerella anatipestifer]|nr:hypothetical protein [Riemerella anatipestifer]